MIRTAGFGGQSVKQKQQGKISPPQKGLYRIGLGAIRPVMRFWFGLHIKNRATETLEGPAVIVAGHEGLLDFMITALAFPRRRINFVGAEMFFRKPWLGRLLNRLGVIAKIQFYPDVNAVMNMMRVTKSGGTIAIFPAGQTSLCGLPANIDPGIVKLVKKMGVQVFAARIHGSFFTLSRYADGKWCRGGCEVETARVFTAEQLKQASEEEIYEAICRSIDYDEYAWQADRRVKFHGRHRAQGYENAIVFCPKCGGELCYRGEGNRIVCEACGNAATIDAYMTLHPQGSQSKCFPTLKEWFGWQMQKLQAQFAREDFQMQTPIRVELLNEKGELYPAGSGVMKLDRQNLSYEGTLEQQREFRYEVKNAAQAGLMAETGHYFELYHPDFGSMRFYPDDGRKVVKWKLAQEYFYQQSTKNNNKA